ncbi:hypothetical protein [Dechloromonas sp.]|uniref:hypothetical protein n=1 Tax=Dechloromonas sp. TaxID=1917218 RepID=UPI00263F92C0|nr:hypothetical protein [Dechloromonas sp.]
MPKKPVIEYDPVNNTDIDEAQLQTKTDDEEWQDLYDTALRPSGLRILVLNGMP